MKNQLKFRTVFLVFLSVFIFTAGFAQNEKKERVRLRAEYVKIMDGEIYFELKASARVDNQNIDVSNINLVAYNIVGDESIKLSETTTNMSGESRIVLKSLNAIQPDSTNTYTIEIVFDGNETFSKASQSLTFKDAALVAKLSTIDSVNYITATLTDKSIDSAVTDALLNVQVERLFSPLKIGEEYNITDHDGAVVVIIPEGIPGIDGNLTIEVVLNKSDEFGTVKALVNAPVGSIINTTSAFDQRKMWSTRDKTPLFLLIFPNLLILGIWGFIIYLFINLFKIAKA